MNIIRKVPILLHTEVNDQFIQDMSVCYSRKTMKKLNDKKNKLFCAQDLFDLDFCVIHNQSFKKHLRWEGCSGSIIWKNYCEAALQITSTWESTNNNGTGKIMDIFNLNFVSYDTIQGSYVPTFSKM